MNKKMAETWLQPRPGLIENHQRKFDMDSITTSPPASKSWDVTDWVSRFEAVGGYLTPGGIGWVIYGRTPDEQMTARAIFAEIEGHEDRRKAVAAFSNQPEQVARYRATLLEGLAA